jgi:protein-L-isoaspartate(D-aspartate) O-methyltransferase
MTPARRRRAGRGAALAVLLALAGAAVRAQTADLFAAARHQMVTRQIHDRGITDAKILSAMEEVPRHLFVPDEYRSLAYEDRSLPIGDGQTIHQPYLVALMTSLLDLDRGAKVLEIGTGSGYHAAVLSQLARQVFTIEINPELGLRARENLNRLGCRNVHTKIGDGYQGWPAEEPFDAIILTAAPNHIPQALIDQLRVGGKMVVPEGGAVQNLVVLTKTEYGYEKRITIPVKLPPMIREGEGGTP